MQHQSSILPSLEIVTTCQGIEEFIPGPVSHMLIHLCHGIACAACKQGQKKNRKIDSAGNGTSLVFLCRTVGLSFSAGLSFSGVLLIADDPKRRKNQEDAKCLQDTRLLSEQDDAHRQRNDQAQSGKCCRQCCSIDTDAGLHEHQPPGKQCCSDQAADQRNRVDPLHQGFIRKTQESHHGACQIVTHQNRVAVLIFPAEYL